MGFPSDSMATTDGFRKEVVAGEPTLVHRSTRRWGRADLAMDGTRQELGEKQQERKGKQVQEETKTVEPKDEAMEDSATEEASKAEVKPHKFMRSRKQSRARPAASYAVAESEEEVQRTRTKRRKQQEQQKGWKDAGLKSEEEDMAKAEAVGKGKNDDVDAGRCKRWDGKTWRCSRPLYRDGWCAYHYEYYEAKRLKLPLPPAPQRQTKTTTQRRKRGIGVDSEYESEEKKQVIPAGKGQNTKAPSEGIAPRGTRSSPTGADKVEDSDEKMSSRFRSSDIEAAESLLSLNLRLRRT